MKPSWNDAPEWANYLAQDENGEWTWFARKPWIVRDVFVSPDEWDYAEVTSDPTGWRDTLDSRPT
jgi:hypothetical protein